MKDNNLLFKISHNKKFLFMVPNLLYVYKLCYYYNSNFDIDHILEITFGEVMAVSVLFFFITWFVYFLVRKVLRDDQHVFCVMCLICAFYFFKFTFISFLLFIVFVLLVIIDFKKIIQLNLDNVIGVVSFVIIALFGISFFESIYYVGGELLKSKSYDNHTSIEVDEKLETPNVYYFHCDGMLGIEAMKKYFFYDNSYLMDYFKDNNFHVNEGANFINGHKTQRSLVALFNPNYYDKFYKEYLDGIEDYYVKGKASNSFSIRYRELEDKRMNNELFRALKEKDYTTVTVGEVNQYTSFYTDYYYDFYVYNQVWQHLVQGKDEFRYMDDSNSRELLLSYIHFVHARSLLSNTMFSSLVEDVNYLDYEEVDYKNFDISDYEYISDSSYWIAKAILKGLNESMKLGERRFVFVDYNLNHLYLTFDKFGNRLGVEEGKDLGNYLGNYVYSSYLLVDMLKFIHDYDENAVIIVEGDHGIHMLDDEYIKNKFTIDMSGVQEIRNSVISAFYVPDKYRNGDEEYLNNPLNISRYLVNSYVGDNYKYLK